MTEPEPSAAHCRHMKMWLIPVFLSLAGCQTAAPPQLAVQQACRATDSRDWQAWINAMPGPNSQPRLIVTGKYTAPSGGYSYRWDSPRVMESYPVQVAVQLIPVPPGGYASDALVEHEVRGEWPMRPPVGSVTITCGDHVLARVSPVPTAL